MYAANFGHPDIVKLFIDHGANVNFQKGRDQHVIFVLGVPQSSRIQGVSKKVFDV